MYTNYPEFTKDYNDDGTLRFMTIEDAAQIVYDLAQQNLLCDDLDELDRIDDSLRSMAIEQHVALVVFHDFVVNHLGDD